MNYMELLGALAPETLVVLTALLALAVDLLVMRLAPQKRRQIVAASIIAVGILAAVTTLSFAAPSPQWMEGLLINNATTAFLKQTLLLLALMAGILSIQSQFTQHTGEYITLLLLSTVGMMLLVSSDNLLLMFISLELASLPLYVLTAFNKESPSSSEAALKYFLIGSLSAACLLFGISLLYGLSGGITVAQLAATLRAGSEPMVYVALVLTLIGFAFKVAAAPFHLWAPDVYQGAPTPVAAFIASGSKVASFFMFGRIFMAGLPGTAGSAAWGGALPGWVPLIAVLAVASMILGNVAAIAQRSVKRLLAYSAIGHAGYALLAILSNTEQGMSALLYYVVTYAVTAMGAFAVVGVVERDVRATNGESLSDFAGLSRRSPMLSLCMLVFALSLAGIPPLAGFFGKFYIFVATARSGASQGLIWLVMLAIGTSAISLYYYLQLLKQIYVVESGDRPTPLRLHPAESACIVAMASAVLLLGCAPDWLINRLSPSATGSRRVGWMPNPSPTPEFVAKVHPVNASWPNTAIGPVQIRPQSETPTTDSQ